jgi:hypothetical protein
LKPIKAVFADAANYQEIAMRPFPLPTQSFLMLLCLVLVGTCTFASAQSKTIYLSPATSSQTKAMTVDDVIKLSKAGLSDDVIIAQIKKRAQAFDLSTDQLIQLKAAHVSDRVIEAMSKPSATGVQVPSMTSASTVSQPGVKAAVPAQGPFGFEKGMTREQIIQMVGRGAIDPDPQDLPHGRLTLTTAPKPHSSFDKYVLYISPKGGLLKVLAIGKDISTDAYGLELQQAYASIVEGVSKKYGPPTNSFDYHKGDLFKDADQWMMALYDKDRTLESFWDITRPINNVTEIKVEAKATGRDTGFVNYVVEFVGWDQYVDERKASQDKSF